MSHARTFNALRPDGNGLRHLLFACTLLVWRRAGTVPARRPHLPHRGSAYRHGFPFSRLVNRLSTFTFGFVVLTFVLISPNRMVAQNTPVIDSAVVDCTANTLSITGSGFSTGPTVTVGTVALTTSSSSSTQIIATFPASSPPCQFTAGDYLLQQLCFIHSTSNGSHILNPITSERLVTGVP